MSDTGQVPPELSSFVGRSAELAAIDDLIAPGRLLTLLGPGGCGKTRLAMRAVRSRPAFWCALDQVSGTPDLAARVAEACGVLLPAGVDPAGALADGLRDREAVIVLDNCEHVVEGAAALADAVLARCPGVSVLATSRTALGIHRERVWRVSPLVLADALALFTDRAEASDDAAARRICERLDRLPLALELAAGWAGTLSLAQIADSLHDPYAMLDGGPVAPFRQQSLEASMRWSHDLLGADEQVLFRRLAVFEPGFDADAVLAVGGPTALPALRGLIAKSLVVADTAGQVARYHLLGVIREYAAARLHDSGETTSTRTAHLNHYLHRTEALAPLLDTDKDDWRAAIAPTYPNIRAALDQALTPDNPTTTTDHATAEATDLTTANSSDLALWRVEAGRRLGVATTWLWHLEPRGVEGLRYLRWAAERGEGERSALQARVLASMALVADIALPGSEGYAAAHQAAELAIETGDAATARLARSLTGVGYIGSDLDAAYAAAVESRDDARCAGDGFVADASGALAGLIELLRDRHRTAIEMIEPCVDGLVRRADRGVGSSALAWLAMAWIRSGDLTRAAGLAVRAIEIAAPLQDFHRIGTARSVLAEIHCARGLPDEAEQALEPLERLVAAAEETPYIPGWERSHALIELGRGNPAGAVDWCRRESRGGVVPLTPDTLLVLAEALRTNGDAAEAKKTLDELEAQPTTAAMPRIRAALLEQRGSLAEDNDTAAELHHEALRIRAAHGLDLDCVETLQSLVLLAIRRGDVEKAAILTGAIDSAREQAGAAPYDPPAQLDPALRRRGTELGLDEAIAYATRNRGPRRRPDSGWASLTPAERSVVELAARGLSNPEIAERLFVSRGTVKTHLQHVYAKLQIANRTELAKLASERP